MSKRDKEKKKKDQKRGVGKWLEGTPLSVLQYTHKEF